MVNIKEYNVVEGLKNVDFVGNGFKYKDGFFETSKALMRNYVYLKLRIDDTNVFPDVRTTDGTYFSPFYDPDQRKANKLYVTVAKNYNKFMDGLVKKGLLTEKETPKAGAKRIEIKYHADIEHLRYIDGKSDWIDLRAAEDVEMKAGEFRLISLGVSMKLPEGYEAHIVPRSSTFKNFGIIETNSIGVIDNTYAGDNDIWRFPAYAVRDTVIHKNDRICQFRIMKNQPEIVFKEVDHLDAESRGGFGSTGKN